MNKTSQIINLIPPEGISTAKLANLTGMRTDSVSGILSSLKHRNKVINIDKRWYLAKSIIKNIIERLEDVNDRSIDNGWSEGYISALADYNIISELQFEELMEYIKKVGVEQ